MWTVIKEVLEVLANLGAVGGLIFAAIQLIQVKKQLELTRKQNADHHEEQRRIKTVEILNDWSKGLKKETRLAEKIVENFDQKQCLSLYEHTPFYVDVATQNIICQMCTKSGDKCEKCKPTNDNKYLVDGSQLTELRGNVTNYLNNLEIVALAWQQAIVDEEALELQFAFLNQKGKKSALYNYRQVAGGGNSYPALNKFYEKIVSNGKVDVKMKEKQ